MINFTRGVPPPEAFPVEQLVAATAAILAEDGGRALQYGPAAGYAPLREWIAEWQGAAPDEVVTGNGSLQLFEFLCLQRVRPGTVVLTEAPTYDRVIRLLRRYGAEVIGIPLAADGPDLDALAAALRRQAPAFFYVIPDFQNPTGVTWSRAKRQAVVELTERQRVPLVEDTPYRALRYHRADEPTLRSLAPDRTLLVSSFTKLLAPGVRVGFAVGTPSLLGDLARVAEDSYISPNYFAQAVVYEFCRRGHLAPQIEALRALYRGRLAATLEAVASHLPEVSVSRPSGGFFVAVTLPAGVPAAAVRAAAATRGLTIADGAAFFPNGGGEGFLRLPFCALRPDEIREGIRLLAEATQHVRRSSGGGDR